MSHIPFWLWFAETTAKSCAVAWLYVRSGQSLAIAIVFHLDVNMIGAIGADSYWVLGGNHCGDRRLPSALCERLKAWKPLTTYWALA